MKVKFKAFAQFSLVALLAAACTSDPDSAGLEYMPDMYRSPAIEPYVDYGEVRGQINDSVKMLRSAMIPPRYVIPYAGTDSATVHTLLPYHRLPGRLFAASHGLYQYDLSSNEDVDFEYKNAAADVNPLKLTSKEVADKIFADGKALYQINCNHCHGEKGDGEGPMVKSGAYTGAAVLSGLAIQEGQMFYSIYYGKGMMGAHASLLNKKEIWTLVHYVRKFQDAKYGTFDANGAPAWGSLAPVADTSAKK
ncbi:c-type cytochrome [Fluviicola taffensis]|uniref:Cytochrome c family protein n=1 Tax=Fluviicola taffensis (strain DSM 16823 / NCIMB 13979 / RW262) TaxID=755732 RepID=F2IB89_FLUTR|nr:cytochrome c [Fluviicola taffensis]AEA43175.1 cytochrome c family protein [Fluviicola taffensis DSM 16823]